MCDFVTIAMMTAATYADSRSKQLEARYQKQIAEQNAALADSKARDAIALGEQSVSKQKLAARQLQGQQLVALASSGVDTTQGTSLNLLGDTAYTSKLQEGVLRANAKRQAYAHRSGAYNFRLQSSLYGARESSISPLLDASLVGFGGLQNKYPNGVLKGIKKDYF